MKKLLFYFCFIIASNLTSLSQDPAPFCDPSCLPQSPWVSRIYLTPVLSTCPNCTAFAAVRERWNTCLNHYEMILEDIGWTGTDCSGCTSDMNFWTWYVFTYVLEHNYYTNQHLTPGGPCVLDFEAGFESCYNYVWSDNCPWQPGGYYHLVRCSDETCCLFRYNICMDLLGNITSQRVGYYDPPPLPPYDCPLPCMMFCGSDFPIYAYIQDEPDGKSKNDIAFFPNPSSGIFKLKVGTFHKGNFKIIINDINGKIVFTKDISLNSDNQEISDWNLSI